MELSFDTNEGGLLAVDSHRSVPAPFLTKTFHFVDDSSTDDIVSWSEDGTTFVVWRPPEFAKDILPNYFKHNNFSSFVRQLNTYGFRKIVSDRWEFANEFFRKGHQDLLCDIHRRKTGQPNVQPTSLRPGSISEDVLWSHISSPLPPPRVTNHSNTGSNHNFGAPVVSICDENERLRRDNCLLMSELGRLRRLNDEVLMFLQSHARLPLQDLGCIKWLKYNSLPPLLPPPASSRFEEIVDDHNPGLVNKAGSGFSSSDEVGRKVSGCFSMAPAAATSYVNENTAPKASTLSFLDSKLKELSNSSRVAKVDAEAPKLFGVLLSGNKRPFSPGNSDTDEPQAKSPRSELSLELNTDPCWLKVCKTVSEKIYI